MGRFIVVRKTGILLLMILTLSGCIQREDQEVLIERETPVQLEPGPLDNGEVNEMETPDPAIPSEPGGEVDVDRLSQVFGFADENGRRLLVSGSEDISKETLSGMTQAIGEKGSLISVVYEGWQEGDDANTGRDTTPNFSHLPGHIFAVTEGVAQPNATYYFFQSEQIPLDSLLPITFDGQVELDSDLGEQIEKEKGRDIHQLWRLATLGGEAELDLALFRPDGPDHLFCIILKQGDNLAVLDFPATTEDSYSVWRVDDQGEIAPHHFTFLFAARTSEQGILIGMEWHGTEGMNTLLLHGTEKRLVKLETRYGRYTSP